MNTPNQKHQLDEIIAVQWLRWLRKERHGNPLQEETEHEWMTLFREGFLTCFKLMKCR